MQLPRGANGKTEMTLGGAAGRTQIGSWFGVQGYEDFQSWIFNYNHSLITTIKLKY